MNKNLLSHRLITIVYIPLILEEQTSNMKKYIRLTRNRFRYKNTFTKKQIFFWHLLSFDEMSPIKASKWQLLNLIIRFILNHVYRKCWNCFHQILCFRSDWHLIAVNINHEPCKGSSLHISSTKTRFCTASITESFSSRRNPPWKKFSG